MFNVGCPYIDLIKSTKIISKDKLFNKLKLDVNKKTIILIQHAVTTEYGESKNQILKTIDALKKLDYNNIKSSLFIQTQIQVQKKLLNK